MNEFEDAPEGEGDEGEGREDDENERPSDD